MATGSGQPQLPRRVSAALPLALTLAVALGEAPLARGQYEPSGYQPNEGEPFFLLSDKAYGTAETAQVRLEIANADFGMAQVEANGGVDVVLYRVPQPVAFLKQQRNLHRIRVAGLAQEEGLANTLSHLWDRWYKASRLAWRRIFSADARKAVTEEAPELKTSPAIHAPTTFHNPPQWKPLPGFDLAARFRYPVHRARAIEPPKDVKLEGSSSGFIAPNAGNVMVPLGRLAPALYLVEAFVGGYRATTLVFVADTVAITKSSADEMLVWTAARTDGAAVPGVELAWTDGTGVLASGNTDSSGLARFAHEAPERSYVFGADPRGGVFISESFYYDSEIHDAKIYAFTDRPLYRPGDQVFVKFVGREFQSARKSIPLAAGDLALAAYDPSGVPVATQTLRIAPDTGADTSFRLPENATGGGYQLQFTYRGNTYEAAFRVAEYQKPHFEINLVPDKPEPKTNEEIGGRLQLAYPDGKPVKDADVQLSVRAQQLTMVEGDLGYSGQFPVKLATEALRSDARGEVRFTLPPAKEPSRYVLTVLATDGAAYRVKTTRELLVERGRSAYTLRADRQFSAPGQTVAFALQAIGTVAAPAVSWEWVRLEDRKHANGTLAAADRLEILFAESGSYTVQLRDAGGNLVGAASHWVSGGGIRPPTGSIAIVASRETCRPGDTVEVLVTFPEPVDQALLTLERDRVEQTALLTTARTWVETTRLGPTQWRARLPVREDFAPNITFSVAYVKNGEYVFQNQGLRVSQPRIEVELRANKDKYAPGETVQVDVTTTVNRKKVAATVAVGVVDEMVYVLQPEIAPDISDFFHHPRRNNVRTASSLSFISYDLAASRSKGAPVQRSVSERRVKVLERPRRDEVDTAFWQPNLRTDSSGRARFTFVMPDSLTRWRITGRAAAVDGTVGQRTAYVRSDKELYVKWTSPAWMREGDMPSAAIAAFNQTEQAQTVDLAVAGPGVSRTDSVTLKPGVNFVAQPLATVSGDGDLKVTLTRAGKVVDALETRFARVPVAWPGPRTVTVDLRDLATPVALPKDARNVRATLASSSAAHFARVIDDLLEYPYGCIEQTASRMIPFALALQSVASGPPTVGDRLRQQLNGQRLRLAYMAGPKAAFAWWGAATTEDPLLTAYAYYADWRAVRALGVALPVEHWNRLLEVYSQDGYKLPFAQRALVLGFMQEMGLPVKGLVEGLLAELPANLLDTAGPPRPLSAQASPFLSEPDGRLGRALALVLSDGLARRVGANVPAAATAPIETSYGILDASGLAVAQALLIANDRLPAAEAPRVIRSVTAEMPTLERALTLVWLQRALDGAGGTARPAGTAPGLAEPWQRITTLGGATQWRWPAGTVPGELRLREAPTQPAAAIVQFDAVAPEVGELPVRLERRFYRVSKNEVQADAEEADDQEKAPSFALQLVRDNAPLSTSELYLDEITITPTGQALRYTVVEAPLPPGASVENTTWGISLRNSDGKAQPLEQARHEATAFGYVVPADPVAGPVVLRHLVRFAQKGVYVRPSARIHRMYQPDAKGFESGGARRRWEVR